MNINDFQNPTEVNIDRLQGIMDRQRELMHKYHNIELKSGLMQTEECPVDIHSKAGQARLKDFSWRITEELMEALEAYRAGDTDHFYEELIDSLHFMMEQHILIGFDHQSYKSYVGDILDLIVKGDSLDFYFANCKGIRHSKQLIINQKSIVNLGIINIIESIGLAMNCLKNKPWKQSHMLTDVAKFNFMMARAFLDYIAIVKHLGVYPDEIYGLYFRKSEVNKFRQRSNY